jgi:hypothetical protein
MAPAARSGNVRHNAIVVEDHQRGASIAYSFGMFNLPGEFPAHFVRAG